MSRSVLVHFLIFATVSAAAHAGPQGGTVIDGAATIQSAGRVTTITQTTDRAILHWQRFESTSTETINFIQPGTSSLTLNRVIGVDPSFLGGALNANGRLFILNPNGIVFGPNAQVSVGSLVASTLKITDDDFRNNRFVFVQDPALELAAVINRGAITAAPGGTVALLAPIVDNSGTIVAAAGRIVLRAGVSAALDLANPNVGPGFTTAGRNVRMATTGLTPLLEDVVNTTSVATADRVQRLSDGTVFLRGAAGIVTQSGTLAVDGPNGGAAGTVTIEAEATAALGPGSRISALGAAGTGAISIVGANQVRFARGGSASSARAVVEAGGTARLEATNDAIVSDAAGSLEVRGGTADLTGVGIGLAAAPVRVNTARVKALSEKGVALVSDGSLTVDTILAQAPGVSITAAGSLLAGTGRTAGVVFIDPVQPLHIGAVGAPVTLSAGGAIGALAVSGALTANAGGGSSAVPVAIQSFALPPHTFAIANDGSTPVARATAFVEPTDPADAAGGASGSGTSDTDVSDNFLLAANRVNTAKREEISSATKKEEEGLVNREELAKISEKDEKAGKLETAEKLETAKEEVAKEEGRGKAEEKPEGSEPEVPENERAEREKKVEESEGGEGGEEKKHGHRRGEKGEAGEKSEGEAAEKDARKP